jgi:hypothetical protein
MIGRFFYLVFVAESCLSPFAPRKATIPPIRIFRNRNYSFSRSPWERNFLTLCVEESPYAAGFTSVRRGFEYFFVEEREISR